jgi:hypothetical protein
MAGPLFSFGHFMAITRTDTVDFLFENANGRLYTVSINKNTGAGVARLQPKVDGVNVVEDKNFDNTETTVQVDGGSLAAWRGWHLSRKIYAAVYNTTQTLSARLNAA